MQVGSNAPQSRLDVAVLGVEVFEMGVSNVGLALDGKDRHDDEPEQAQQRDRHNGPRPKTHPADTRQMMSVTV